MVEMGKSEDWYFVGVIEVEVSCGKFVWGWFIGGKWNVGVVVYFCFIFWFDIMLLRINLVFSDD